MTLLDRYSTKEFFKYFFLLMASFLSLYLIVDFFEKIRMFMSNHATVGQIILFFLFSIPMIIQQVMPAAVLIAALVSVGMLSRNNEITAMKACGISLYRTAAPLIAAASLLCLASFVISEAVTPAAGEKARNILLVEVQKTKAPGMFTQNQFWYRGQKGIYNFRVFDPQSDSLQGIAIYYPDAKFHLKRRVDAESGKWQDGAWVLRNVLTTTFPREGFPEIEANPRAVSDIPEGPDNFKTIQRDAESMGFLELRNYILNVQAAGYNASGYLADLYGKLAFPFVNIIMAAIGFSFALLGGGRGGIARGVAAGIIIGLSYWFVQAFTVSMGHAETMAPLPAAWLPNILFGAAAALLFMRLRT